MLAAAQDAVNTLKKFLGTDLLESQRRKKNYNEPS
jgi:hypothetical protein